MPTATYVHKGDTIDYTPGAAVAAGDVVVQVDLVGITKVPIVANRLGALAVVGVFDVPKSPGSGTALPVGTKVWWDATNEVATTTVGANKRLGTVTKAATDDDTSVRVRLLPT